jgi:hypothetical protein
VVVVIGTVDLVVVAKEELADQGAAHEIARQGRSRSRHRRRFAGVPALLVKFSSPASEPARKTQYRGRCRPESKASTPTYSVIETAPAVNVSS